MMNYNNWTWGYSPAYSMMGGFFGAWFGFFVIPLLIWSLFWKGWALWAAARNGSKAWFIALLLINTVGLLDIAYIFLFAKKSSKKK